MIVLGAPATATATTPSPNQHCVFPIACVVAAQSTVSSGRRGVVCMSHGIACMTPRCGPVGQVVRVRWGGVDCGVINATIRCLFGDEVAAGTSGIDASVRTSLLAVRRARNSRWRMLLVAAFARAAVCLFCAWMRSVASCAGPLHRLPRARSAQLGPCHCLWQPHGAGAAAGADARGSRLCPWHRQSLVANDGGHGSDDP